MHAEWRDGRSRAGGIVIALYARVSRDDGEPGSSGSIAGQRLMLEEWARGRSDSAVDLPPESLSCDIAFFADDGFSGLSMERPGLRKLLSLCATGAVECVVVRDLSRLSRSYIDLGRLLEVLFPSAGVRFVSLAEGIDLRPDAHPPGAEAGLVRALLALANNAYSLQLSRGVRASMRIRWEAGEHVQAFAPFGYAYDASARGNLRIDDVAAGWVAAMFEMASAGVSPASIACELVALGVPTPAAYANVCGGSKAGVWGDDPGPWNGRKVRWILGREVYCGVLVGGVTIGVGVGRGSPRRITCDTERVRIEDAHDAIVSRELFDEVQEALKRVPRGRPRRGSS